MKKILIIQTAFIGDVILATSLVELTKLKFPDSEIDFCLRQGNESIMQSHPAINRVWVWNKKGNKYSNLLKIAWQIRKQKYDLVLNIQRFFNSGLITWLSNSKMTIGFDKNPLSFLFTRKVKHKIPYQSRLHAQSHNTVKFLHEVQRNALLLGEITGESISDAHSIPPRLYPNAKHQAKVQSIISTDCEYIVLAPASVWFTKQWAQEKWKELTQTLSQNYKLYFIGAPTDTDFANEIISHSSNCTNLCGKLSLMESALLMQKAKRVFVNDSAPLHLASGVNAKVTAIFCSTIPEFGYTPLTSDSKLIQLSPRLECMPCGLHGKKQCPQGHFKCAFEISTEDVIATID